MPIGNIAGQQAPEQPGAVQGQDQGRQPAADLAPELRNAQAMPEPPTRLGRALDIAGRVMAGVVTLGISELVNAAEFLGQRAGERASARGGLPPFPPAVMRHNHLLSEALHNAPDTLEPSFRSAVDDASNALRETFGDLVSQDPGLAAISRSPAFVRELNVAIAAERGYLSAPRLNAIVQEKAAPFLKEKAAENVLAAKFAAMQSPLSAAANMDALFEAIPGLRGALNACADRAAIDRVIAENREGIEAFGARADSLRTAQNAGREHALAELARELGMSREDAGRIDLTALDKEFAALADDMKAGRVGQEAGTQAFMAKAAAFVQQKLDLVRAADEQELSPAMAERWKAVALADKGALTPEHLRHAVQAAGETDAAAFLALVQAEEPAPAADLSAALMRLAASLQDKLRQLCGDEAWQKLGQQGRDQLFEAAARVMRDRSPALEAALEQKAELFAALRENAQRDLEEARRSGDAGRIAGAGCAQAFAAAALEQRQAAVQQEDLPAIEEADERDEDDPNALPDAPLPGNHGEVQEEGEGPQEQRQDALVEA